MIEYIIRLSVKNKLLIILLVFSLIGAGIYSLRQLPINAVPDITNNQVQVVTVSNSLAPQEVEQFITYPIEVVMANIPNVIEIRSISRFGLSVVTIVFEDWVPILEARQFVKEQISQAEGEIPEGLGTPELMPITTGLGEIYQYVLEVEPGYEDQYDPMKLRTIQDWIVKRQLAGIQGIIEISSFGGYLKQYEIAIDPLLLESAKVSLAEVFEALSRNNQNSGGSYIEKGSNAYYIRTEGLVKNKKEIEQIVVSNRNNIPVLVRDIGNVQLGSPKRFGAMTMDGKGEVVGGITLMYKGANSSAATKNVKDRVDAVKKSLPEGVHLYPYLDRSVLVGKTIATVETNLLEGGLIVILVLVLLLGDFRAGLIVASIIPLAMLFALIMMNLFGVSANLMSLGAIDFGIVVDGAVIIVEGVVHTLFAYHVGKQLSQKEMDEIIIQSSSNLFRSAIFGVFIILVVFIPIMTLTGIEGKMFRPMAITFSFAVLGALILSLTYVPMMSAWVLPKTIKDKTTIADRILNALKSVYTPALKGALRVYPIILVVAVGLLGGSYLLFSRMGAEFIPTLEEGDLAMQMAIQPGSALNESIHTTTKAEKILLDNFPEIKHVVSKIGTAEVPTDPMAIEDADIMIILKEKEEWTSADNREDLVEKMKASLEVIPAATFEFTQPIQLRFNELMTGAKTDIAIKIFGENTEELKRQADRAAVLITDIQGIGDIKVDQTEGLAQLKVEFDRKKIAEYGLNIEELNTYIRTAYTGEKAGVVFENERKFDLVVRFDEVNRAELNLNKLFIHLPNGSSIPFSELATINYTEGPMQISREDARRRINIGVNVRNRDVASLVADIRQRLDEQLELPPGYYIRFGGQFENLEKAQRRLSLAVPAALILIFFFLYFTFGKIKYALIIFTAVPFAAIGGIWALWLRGMPFSISAGVGFIALFGVAVLNGIVLISYFNQLKEEGQLSDLKQIVIQGGATRLRPVIMTATVAALGFLPMALSTSNGAEVQKPLATVVIGGLITATILTLIVLPILYYLIDQRTWKIKAGGILPIIVLLGLPHIGSAQQQPLSLERAIDHVQKEHPLLKNATINIQQATLGIKEAQAVDPLEVDVQIGQFNTTLVDYSVAIMQPLPNLKANKARKKRAERQIAQSEKELALLEYQLIYQLKQAWNQWLFLETQLKTVENQVNLMESLLEKAQLQLDVGETSGLEKNVLESSYTQIIRDLQKLQLEATQAYNEVLAIANFGDSLLAPSDISLVPLPFPGQLESENLFLEPLQRQIEVHQQEVEIQNSLKRPTFSVGYFNLSIRPEYSLQGVLGRVQIPIWNKAPNARIEQRQLDVNTAQNELDFRKKQLAIQQSNARTQALLLKDQLEKNGQTFRTQAAEIRQLSQYRLDNGAINYFQFIQSTQTALDSELAYWELVYQYNEAVIRLKYFRN